MGAPFDARRGVRTGISAADRARTVRQAVDPGSGPSDFVIPGHVQPLAAHSGGLATRQGHTEGSVALARLGGLAPAVVMSEVLTEAGHGRPRRPGGLGAAPRLPHRHRGGRGSRLTTYAIAGPRGSGMVCVNGAAAHLNHPGDVVILATFADMTPEEARGFKPTVARVDEKNRPLADTAQETPAPLP